MILRFFKKKKAPKAKPEKIHLDEIENWLDEKTEKLTEKEEEAFVSIKEKVDSFILTSNEKIKVLEDIDIEAKKVIEKEKIFVRQGLNEYLNIVSVFRKELTTIQKQNLNQFIKDINKSFSSFDKRSYLFYQRANYLVGDELVALKENINDLSTYFTKLFDKNKKTIHSFSTISYIKSKLAQLNETNAVLNEIESEIESSDKRKKESEKRKIYILDKIEKIKISKNYLENIEKENQIKLSKKQLENDILILKSLINFKSLTNAFHSNEKKMEKIRSYKENFQRDFQKDNGEDILKLINEAKLDDKLVLNKIKQINKRSSKISEDKKLIEENEVDNLSKGIEEIKLELENIIIEKTKHNKKTEKIKENKKTILKSISLSISKLNGILIH